MQPAEPGRTLFLFLCTIINHNRRRRKSRRAHASLIYPLPLYCYKSIWKHHCAKNSLLPNSTVQDPKGEDPWVSSVSSIVPIQAPPELLVAFHLKHMFTIFYVTLLALQKLLHDNCVGFGFGFLGFLFACFAYNHSGLCFLCWNFRMKAIGQDLSFCAAL